ncbi:UDP-N-acetylenolpyruvoylglucosamine reductase [Oscillochloris trichoides DG-6]|uniref:UDP-N-acetylenolpyruvoylglucosamine reductase n=1 Tax=Oscillochloris trichoides DG-6 TaxID=765420 RepID=E1IHI3_9CHLR|nr:UDP-N-acetylmuramate dehydrogenase [Oscillochloris trichoides]EFO79346.1 UDP-N-acetylenolpyruvoylglucosamine reductase [Oscillochloris trichoides DG-6]
MNHSKPPIPLREDEPMARHTSWRIGGPARYYGEVSRVEDALAVMAWAKAEQLDLIWMGGGTNVLVQDAGFAGVIVRYVAQEWHIEEQEDVGILHVDSGASVASLARRMGNLGWAGLEWAEGIPGTIGGAVFGNAGSYGSDISAILLGVSVIMENHVEQWPASRMGFGYRRSVLKDGEHSSTGVPPLIVGASLRMRRGDPKVLAATMARIAAERKNNAPFGRTCGSVFKNPIGYSAGQLIDRAGLKGTRLGDAEISQRHANYIINLGGATSADVLGLIEIAREAVRNKFGIELELEVRLI